MFGFGKKHREVTDEELVTQMLGGNPAAFNQLYVRYYKRLFYYFYRMLGNSEPKAQDFLQDIFVKIIDKAGSFDPYKKFSTWIFSIAHNMCKNEYRRMNIHLETPLEVWHDTCDESMEIEDSVALVDPIAFQRELFDVLEMFDEMHKSVFLLHYREGFSLKDIAQSLEISEGTVKSRLFYTRKRLAGALVKHKPNAFN
jgi:RNA polymerase sigma-70 factor, ECF subfamily